MKYGQLPAQLGTYEVECNEMMFYQYLPIKMPNETQPIYEPRLKCFDKLIGAICCDFIGTYGLDRYVASYVYLTAKMLYVQPNCSFNRPGYHSDGFMTDDINYVWSDKLPTVFNQSEYALTKHHEFSLTEMDIQSLKENEVTFGENTLLRLDEFNIHKVADVKEGCMRTFLKVSISKDKYDLLGNSHNYLLDYNWQMKKRQLERNIPQTVQQVKGGNTCP